MLPRLAFHCIPNIHAYPSSRTNPWSSSSRTQHISIRRPWDVSTPLPSMSIFPRRLAFVLFIVVHLALLPGIGL
jgi:hypothetical protein